VFDVVVVGGNLAGVSAAINAASKGVNVALIERNPIPLSPAHCGEIVTDICENLLLLDEIGCQKNIFKKMIVNVASPKEYIFHIKKNHLISFDRNYTEKALLKKAEKIGVKVFLGTNMRGFKPPYEVVVDNNKIIKGKIIIDSSGIACQVGRRIGLKTKLKKEDIGVCIQSRVQGNFNSDTIKFWFHKPYAPFGYAWVIPKDKKTANIGIGIRGGQKQDMEKLLKEYINDISEGTIKVASTFRDCVPIAPPLHPLFKDNVMITGDAARLVDAIGAAGIKQAILSGSLAGRVAANYIHGEISSLEIYQDLMSIMTKRILKLYKRSNYIYETEERLIKRYQRGFKLLYFANRIAPNFLQNRFVKFLEKETEVLKSYK